MTGAVTITIGGEPVAKGRARATRRGFMYTPAKTRRYEAHGRLAAQLAMNGRPPINVPVRAEIVIDLPAPASWSGKRREAALRGDVRPTTRPDADNYVKAALDAINAIVVSDDSMIVDLVVTKKYATVPALTIVVTPLPRSPRKAGQYERPTRHVRRAAARRDPRRLGDHDARAVPPLPRKRRPRSQRAQCRHLPNAARGRERHLG